MDQFDDFEFKPITEGLGFHKKSVQLKNELDVSESIPGISVPPAPAKLKPETAKPIKTHLPIHDFMDTPAAQSATTSTSISTRSNLGNATSATNSTMPGPMAAPSWKTNPNPTPAQRRPQVQSQPEIRMIKEVPVSFSAIIFDTIVVMGLTCLFAVAVLLVTNVDFLGILTMATQDWMTGISLALLFISSMELYFIIFRSFMGSTLGEWAFDIELGTAQQQASYSYPLRVILRSLIVMATGLIILPILSFIMNRDIAGALSGLRLRRGFVDGENVG